MEPGSIIRATSAGHRLPDVISAIEGVAAQGLPPTYAGLGDYEECLARAKSKNDFHAVTHMGSQPLFLAAISILAWSPCLQGQPVAPAEKTTALVITLINAERAQQHLKPLKSNSLLAKAAQSQSDWMARVGRMDHLRGPQPKTLADFRSTEWHAMNRLVKVGYYRFDEIFTPALEGGVEAVVPDPQVNEMIGENVAYGNKNTGPGRFDPTVIVKGWMDSPGHRAAIVNDRFLEIGAGYSTTPGVRDKSQQATAWCVVFTGPKK